MFTPCYIASFISAVCMNGEMRAVGANITQDSLSGDTLVSARVQLCLLDQWADICDTDVGNKQRWHSVDGDVACKQLRNDNSSTPRVLLVWNFSFILLFFPEIIYAEIMFFFLFYTQPSIHQLQLTHLGTLLE